MAILRAVREADLPRGCVGAGVVRSLVWDALHDRPEWTMRGDVDVVYFDDTDLSESSQSAYLARLREIEPDIPWEVVNQAGVHLWYERHFGFAVAPWGLGDLFSMTVRHNPTRASLAEYHRRVQAKRYAERWPRVTVV